MSLTLLKEIDDSTLLQEAAIRLLKRFKERNGIEMKYGGFNFIIHEGKFFQIEDFLKDKSFFTDDYTNTNKRRRGR
ncbi:MAG: hypothetical protein HOO06_05100 [Bdellovibrionaceae bacterium]|jgi:hypothetical protein|nr:hypothetical protein [Pseudobdellovibrionaceae bacterium]